MNDLKQIRGIYRTVINNSIDKVVILSHAHVD